MRSGGDSRRLGGEPFPVCISIGIVVFLSSPVLSLADRGAGECIVYMGLALEIFCRLHCPRVVSRTTGLRIAGSRRYSWTDGSSQAHLEAPS